MIFVLAVGDTPALDLELDTHTALLDFKGALGSFDFKTGVMGRYQNNFANPDTGIRRLIPDYNKYDFGIYGVLDFKINERLQSEGGFRFDYTYTWTF